MIQSSGGKVGLPRGAHDLAGSFGVSRIGRAVKSVLASLVLASAALLLSATVGPVSGAMRALSEAEQAAKQAVHEGLLPRLQAGGVARVIVRLNTPFQLQPLLPGRASVQAQQRAIAQAQEGVLRRL